MLYCEHSVINIECNAGIYKDESAITKDKVAVAEIGIKSSININKSVVRQGT